MIKYVMRKLNLLAAMGFGCNIHWPVSSHVACSPSRMESVVSNTTTIEAAHKLRKLFEGRHLVVMT
jgi:hypothetical protein